ncbi:hypothetical protein [uncultured Victivallis sp.]|uniref:hypothetical protein n=1 Tax=uncultured Victivallis sp. TaxID=354118 RepID=UPI0025EC4B34|nr:hypothetical protein [uncultured Victivallis sp.]
MQKERQVIARLNAFLESNDWVNSPASREILAAYTECCVEANSRLDQCSALLLRKMTVEAVNLASREPSLFEIVPLLNFPRLPEFLELCEWYDWSAPPRLNMPVFEQLKNASGGLSDLMELLNEYRRIARGRNLQEKIRLLRKIAELDPRNPEWKQNQKQIETEYLPDLIDRARSAIEQKRFAELETLQKELTDPAWQVPVPAIVLSKIGKVLDEYHQAERKKAAVAILEEINLAYGIFDVSQLGDAIARWDAICRLEDYEPDPNEQLQVDDAREWLEEKRKTEAAQEAFSTSLKRVNYLLDSEAPLEEVEQEFATLSALEKPIPDYLVDRIAMYRQICENEARHRRILRTVKLVAACLVGILVLGGVGYSVVYYQIEKSQTERLRAVIQDRKLLEARKMLKSIEESYPAIAQGAAITELRGELSRLEYEITTAREDFRNRIADVDEELKRGVPDEAFIRSKFAECEKLVYFEEDKRALSEKRSEAERRIAAARREADKQFLEQVRHLKEIRADFFRFLGEHDFANAERILDEFRVEAGKAAAQKGVSADNREEYAELINSYEKLFQYFEDDKEIQALVTRLRQMVLAANTTSAVAEAVADFKKSTTDRNLPPSDQAFVEALSGDSEALLAIAAYQEKPATTPLPKESSVAFFQDAKKSRALSESFDAARKKMIESYELLMTSVVRNRLRMFSFKDRNGREISIYFPQSRTVSAMYDSGSRKFQFQAENGLPVEIEVDRVASVKVGDTLYADIRPVYPARLDRNSLLNATAPHQLLASETLTMLRGLDGVLYEQKIVEAIGRIISDPNCNPYWKLQLCSRLVNAMQQLEVIDTKPYTELKKLIDELLAADNSGNGMNNELLNDRIRSELARVRMEELFGNLAANHFLVRLISGATARKLQFLGVIQRNAGRTVFHKSRYVERETGEVWCFDDSRRGCWLAGSFRGDEITWDPAIQERARSCVAFTPVDGNDTRQWIANERAEAKKAGVTEIPWPAFWPQNVTEGENR